ncbi:RNA polymerase sigma factor [Micromonospora sp. NBC_01796]|uniref:RNA polymerase sigma factor n=1 Tax=Micromonospora sp. NBC_01796 TaxID=2975987 RepID=UPI002DDB9C2B|nr:sigma-70 family RNA polymerase sigma factor [Micromonospora sp. NBC_01796]WSA82980.1 sigma-70 family RNA polymerase sigma factor [Micromonospora sp. NBC_01796]
MGPPHRRDESWFTGIYTEHHAHIVSYGQRRLGDPEASAELAQEVFVIAWRRRAEVPDRTLPWLYGVARRLLANHWRARRAAPDVLPIGDPERLWEPVPSGPEASVAVADIRTALATLTDLDQEILRLVGWEELTVSEAAQVLGCTRTTAAVRLHRARKRLTAAITTCTARPVQQPAPARS